MWVLSRKKNEQLVINGNIIITVIDIRGDKVRLGIESPKEVPVHRKEVYDAIFRSTPLPEAVSLTPPGSAAQTAAAAAPPQVDKIARLAAALQTRLGVTISRETVARALQEAGVELPE